MADSFKPPPLSAHEGPAGGFTPPPLVEDKAAKAPSEPFSIANTAKAFGQQGIGIAKQLGRDAYGIGQTLMSPMGIPDPGWTGLNQRVQAATEPTNTNQKIGGWLGTAGEMAIPLPGGKVRAFESLAPVAEKMYQGALRPRPSIGVNAAKDLVSTGLRERIPVSEGGVQKLGGIVHGLNEKIGEHISGSTAEISPTKVAGAIDTVHPSFATQVNPQADINTLGRVKGEYLGKHTQQIPFTKVEPGMEEEAGRLVPVGKGTVPLIRSISPAEAQAEKVATYRQLSGKYGGELSSADIEGQKALARGLRGEIGRAVPAVHPLNAREGKLLELQGPLERATVRGGNAETVPIGGTMVSIARKILDNPSMKSNAAIQLNRAAQIPTRGRGIIGTAIKANQKENQ
jgi:hypothetical protein